MFKKLIEKRKLKKEMIEREMIEKENLEKEKAKQLKEEEDKAFEECQKRDLYYKNCPSCLSTNYVHNFQVIYDVTSVYFKCKDCNYEEQKGYKDIEEARERSFARQKISTGLLELLKPFKWLSYDDTRKILIYTLKEKHWLLHNDLID